jgi:hypothetical protein
MPMSVSGVTTFATRGNLFIHHTSSRGVIHVEGLETAVPVSRNIFVFLVHLLIMQQDPHLLPPDDEFFVDLQ